MPNIVLIAALFVIGEGLVRTGVAQRLGDWLTKTAGASETRLLVLLMLAVGILGSVMSSTGVIAIFIPVALRIAQSTGMAASRLMMPMSMAALISGMMTLVGTAPNLVVNSELTRQGADGFSVLQFHAVWRAHSRIGNPLHALRTPLAILVRGGESKSSHRPSLRDWVEEYKLADREHRVRVTDRSPLVGKTIGETELRNTSGASIVAIERTASRSSRRIICPSATTVLQADDILLVDLFGRQDTPVGVFETELHFEMLPLSGDYFTDRSQEIGMAEVMLGTNSDLAGKTVVESRLRSRAPAHGDRSAARQRRHRKATCWRKN